MEGERGIDVPEEMARVSGVKFVWLCTIGQDKGVGRYFISILRDWRSRVKQRVKPGDSHSSKFFLGLTVGELPLWHQFGRRGQSQLLKLPWL